jgi:O-acetyl-ADP-ribose deacetylase (regulator of RNase III)
LIRIIRADITTLVVDAIVNAASEEFRGGGGVDGAIHRAAGPELLEECRRYPRLPTGEAVITAGHALPARFVIHTVGPIWRGGRSGESELLERAYESVFKAAASVGRIRTIAFPAISTGVYGYPKREAARIALTAMRANEPHFDGIIACLFSDEDVALYRELLGAAKQPEK